MSTYGRGGTYAPAADRLREMLRGWRTVAVVGLSSDPSKPSWQVARYLKSRGYRIVPVNPTETEVLGEKAYPSLAEVPERIDVVDVFRRPEHTPEVARAAVAVGAKALWLQQGIVNDEARRIAEEGGLDVVMGLCMQTVHRVLDVEEV